MRLDEYREYERAEREAERDKALRTAERVSEAMARQGQSPPVRWDLKNPPPDAGQVGAACLIFVSLPLTVALGAVLLVAFAVLGLPAWVPIAGTVVGVVGGYLVCDAGDTMGRRALRALAYRSAWVDRHGAGILTLSEWFLLAVALLLPPGLMIGTTIALLQWSS